MWEKETRSAVETERLGQLLGELVRPGDVVLLSGDLGAGKTTFTRGLARGAGVTEPVTSPTFTLLHQYAGRLPVYHCDLYRWPPAEDLSELGLPEYLSGDGVTVVEWPSPLGRWTPAEYLEVELRLSPPGRRLAVKGHGARGRELEEGFRRATEGEGAAGGGPGAGGEAGC
ncbi:MAG TPA: tRNA (adenosine(37)-N6)-threonylcarbamoyltransferase complex ATPase subunit type 1 TsaE [Firmicutes bacterium]|nr:tRNA (adenosine(37)-N6)-threonylcarbamoyltransferase complex ATPase subunit type 1 TsaE [Bacillota bacterium]